MPFTFIILLAVIVAVIGGVMLVATRHKRAGAILLFAGLGIAVGLSLLLILSLQTM
jgi:hypothetical protein